jgi:hypothetical protein
MNRLFVYKFELEEWGDSLFLTKNIAISLLGYYRIPADFESMELKG